ncbi:putative Chromatin-remodeling complex ATPase chain Iswi [Blattamonas nauphoetae]|uniref:Chromatin-remodeling complex ATPase chain Iswi n=1 Tax=Blattamonas nauphoetae TaxID=2049346 RepID=A0ABQ9XIZ3_9EUKA|nr:putative Chromatin-remodeling complex ATPase chain Iswi [Blattamonas nauphoetae]
MSGHQDDSSSEIEDVNVELDEEDLRIANQEEAENNVVLKSIKGEVSNLLRNQLQGTPQTNGQVNLKRTPSHRPQLQKRLSHTGDDNEEIDDDATQTQALDQDGDNDDETGLLSILQQIQVKRNVTHLDVQPSGVRGQMRSYQLEGLNWLISLYENNLHGILADEMGLGKTLQSLSLLVYLKVHRGKPGPHLVVAPKSTMGNWMNEVRKFCPTLKAVRLIGSKEERPEIIRTQLRPGTFDLCITTYEMILVEKAALRKIKWDYIIIDEAHRMKNDQAKFSIVIRSFYSQHRLLLTGTPLQNNLHELWALLNFLLPTVFSDSSIFDESFKLTKHQSELFVSQLHRILRPFLLRRLKSDVETLPQKKETIVFVPLTSQQKMWYRSLLFKDIDAINGLSNDRMRLLNIAMHMRKCCNHPYLFPNSQPPFPEAKKNAQGQLQRDPRELKEWGEQLINASGKMKVLMGLLGKCWEQKSKVVVFCQMTKMLDIIQDALWLNGIQCFRIDGNTNMDDREYQIEHFVNEWHPRTPRPDFMSGSRQAAALERDAIARAEREKDKRRRRKAGEEVDDSDDAPSAIDVDSQDDRTWIFLISTRAGGLGISLVAANTVILYDSDWNPQADLQAIDRCHRIGQKKEVRIWRFVSEHTIEEKIVERARMKLHLDHIVIQKGRLVENDSSSKLAKEDLLSMVRHGAREILNEDQDGDAQDGGPKSPVQPTVDVEKAAEMKGKAKLAEEATFDLEKLLARSMEKTGEWNNKMEKKGEDFTLVFDGTYGQESGTSTTDKRFWGDEDDGLTYTDENGEVVSLTAPIIIDMPRQRANMKPTMNENEYFRQAFAKLSSDKTKRKERRKEEQEERRMRKLILDKLQKPPVTFPFQFYPPRFVYLCDKLEQKEKEFLVDFGEDIQRTWERRKRMGMNELRKMEKTRQKELRKDERKAERKRREKIRAMLATMEKEKAHRQAKQESEMLKDEPVTSPEALESVTPFSTLVFNPLNVTPTPADTSPFANTPGIPSPTPPPLLTSPTPLPFQLIKTQEPFKAEETTQVEGSEMLKDEPADESLKEPTLSKPSPVLPSVETDPLTKDDTQTDSTVLVPDFLTLSELHDLSVLSKQGFPKWSRKDFNSFVRLSAKYGRDQLGLITSELQGKTEEEVTAYSQVFWERGYELEEWEKVKGQIEKGEERMKRMEEEKQAITHMVDQLKLKREESMRNVFTIDDPTQLTFTTPFTFISPSTAQSTTQPVHPFTIDDILPAAVPTFLQIPTSENPASFSMYVKALPPSQVTKQGLKPHDTPPATLSSNAITNLCWSGSDERAMAMLLYQQPELYGRWELLKEVVVMSPLFAFRPFAKSRSVEEIRRKAESVAHAIIKADEKEKERMRREDERKQEKERLDKEKLKEAKKLAKAKQAQPKPKAVVEKQKRSKPTKPEKEPATTETGDVQKRAPKRPKKKNDQPPESSIPPMPADNVIP